MIVLKIKKVVNWKPIPWTDSLSKEGQSFSMFSGDHPSHPEKGSVILDVGLVDGNFENITTLNFLSEEPPKGTLLSHEKKLLGGYRIEVAFDTVFRHGLAYMAQHFVQEKVGILGFTSEDRMTLQTISGQRKLLRKLALLIIPTRLQQISELALPSLHLIPNQQHDATKSHFMGDPKLPAGHEVPTTLEKIELFHLATISTKEFAIEWGFPNPLPYLSFYLNIKNTENGWPAKPGDFKVFHYANQQTQKSRQFAAIESEMNFTGREILEIPRYDHSALSLLELDDDEQEQYEVLSSMFTNVLSEENESDGSNKLFGYPDNVQACVAFEAERIKSLRDYSDEVIRDGAKWRLLFQICPYAHWFSFFDEFGDATIYFMIQEDDLNSGNFDNIQVVAQNT